jgi:hypothetical protein
MPPKNSHKAVSNRELGHMKKIKKVQKTVKEEREAKQRAQFINEYVAIHGHPPEFV